MKNLPRSIGESILLRNGTRVIPSKHASWEVRQISQMEFALCYRFGEEFYTDGHGVYIARTAAQRWHLMINGTSFLFAAFKDVDTVMMGLETGNPREYDTIYDTHKFVKPFIWK